MLLFPKMSEIPVVAFRVLEDDFFRFFTERSG